MSARFRTLCLSLALFASSLTPAWAETQVSQGIAVKLTLSHAELEQAELARALEHELGAPVELGARSGAHLEIAIRGRRAEVSYFAPDGSSVTRRIELPADKARASEAVAFLVGNLARDQAGELLESLRPKPAAESAPEPEPASTPESAPAPEPKPAPEKPKPPPEKPKPAVSPAQAAPASELTPAFVNLSFYDPITLRPHSEKLALNLELGFLYSHVGAIEGGALTLGYLRIEQRARGGLVGLGYLRTGSLEGASLSMVSRGSGSLHGAEASGFVGWRAGWVRGGQASGLVSLSGALEGAQVSGLFGYAPELSGAQLAGLMVYTHRLRGFQLAGLTSLAGDVDGAQVAAVDIANDVAGLQIGLVNVGRRVKGMQLGFVNVSKEIHGGALGFVNIAGNGRIQPALWVSGPDGLANVGLKFLTDYTYMLAGVGSNASAERGRYEAGLGVHLPLGPIFFGELGASYAEVLSRRAGQLHTDRRELRPRLTAGARVLPWLEPFAAAGLVNRLTGSGSDVGLEYLGGVSFPISIH